MASSATANATGTLSAGAGWVEATCTNTSGCITIEWTPNRDDNKGTGWKFDVSCQARAASISVADVIMDKIDLDLCGDLATV